MIWVLYLNRAVSFMKSGSYGTNLLMYCYGQGHPFLVYSHEDIIQAFEFPEEVFWTIRYLYFFVL